MAEAAPIYEGAIDKGLEGVVACHTAISFIVGATLNYRGYTIEDLAANSTFEEVVFLLWNNRLPNKAELDGLKKDLAGEMKIEADLLASLKTIPTKGVHPMAWMRTATSMMGMFDKNAELKTPDANMKVALRLTAKMGLLVSTFERLRTGQDIVTPNPSKSLAWNFFWTLTGKEPDAEIVKTFDTCLVLHADHELNCSAFAARVTSSSLSDVYSSVVSAISALKGPLHGGANEQVMLMLKEIGTMDKARPWVEDALNNKVKVMGFGHRVYKNGDPRAKILRQMSDRLTAKLGQHHWYEMSDLIDDAMQNKKGLLPNVDFYSATVYYAMGIPIDLYTPIFAASRVSGWLAHIFEQWTNNRIYRPRGKWTGKEGLTWKPVEQR
ncbi:MAG TPA: citrate/2-methylcitrate synthase [Bdellovibrionales bacterium]|nr:citrate/2-methylcitrate synthase [Bdellovibrionales bacterium]